MRGDVVELSGQRLSDVELVGAPVRRESRVERIGLQRGVAHPLRARHRLLGELHRTGRVPCVHPAAGQSRRQPRPWLVVGRAAQHVVQLRGESPGLGAEQLPGGQSEDGARPAIKVVVGPAAFGGRSVQADRRLPSTGGALGVRSVEEISAGGPFGRHASS